MVKKARARLFGSWEMNWMAYNFAHDVALPGSSGARARFNTKSSFDCSRATAQIANWLRNACTAKGIKGTSAIPLGVLESGTSITQTRKVVGWNDTKLAYINEGFDFRLA